MRLNRLAVVPLAYERALRQLARSQPDEPPGVARYVCRFIEADGAVSTEEADFALALSELRV